MTGLPADTHSSKFVTCTLVVFSLLVLFSLTFGIIKKKIINTVSIEGRIMTRKVLIVGCVFILVN